jgi:hypothetical protein
MTANISMAAESSHEAVRQLNASMCMDQVLETRYAKTSSSC